VKTAYNIALFSLCMTGCFLAKAQSSLHPDSVIYRKSWEAGARLRSDGFGLEAEFTRARRFTRSILYQVQFNYFWHPKQAKQSSQYGGGGLFSSDGFKRFVYGKQNTLFTLYGGVGQKFLLAEKGKRHGVQLFFKYAGGFSLAILKPYMLQILDTNALTTADYKDVGYDQNNNNGFLDFNRILGASGFGKGWKLKALPALHAEIGMEFDWGKNESVIKALEIGVASDFYFKKVPVMVLNNKFLYPSVYMGFLMGKRKER
jgi:hypothetical protein